MDIVTSVELCNGWYITKGTEENLVYYIHHRIIDETRHSPVNSCQVRYHEFCVCRVFFIQHCVYEGVIIKGHVHFVFS